MAITEEPKRLEGMKIAQLCKESGLTRSTIHHYLNIGLLHRPKQAGLNLHLFDESHLNRLRQIRRLREKEGLSLARIREFLNRIEPLEVVHSMPAGRIDAAKEVRSEAGAIQRGSIRQGHRNRDRILDVAIKLFSERGYENTKISDIAEALHMGKGTFYVYFKNKKELFMECIDRVTVTIVPREAWAEIRREEDFRQKTRKRGVAFLNAFPGFRGILNLLRVALGGNDPALARKAKEAFSVLSAPMAKDLSRAIAEGTVRPDLDVSLFSFLQLAIAEGLGYWLMMDSKFSIVEGMDLLLDVFGPGLAPRSDTKPRADNQRGASGRLLDSKGVTTCLKDILVNGEPMLRGRIGEGEVTLDLTRLERVEFFREEGASVVKARLKDGNEAVLEVEGKGTATAESACGPFQIPLERVVSISFGEETRERELL